MPTGSLLCRPAVEKAASDAQNAGHRHIEPRESKLASPPASFFRPPTRRAAGIDPVLGNSRLGLA
jgi:hypothetical protein